MIVQEEFGQVSGGVNTKTTSYYIDYFSCIRCGACAAECPQDAIFTDDAEILQSKCNQCEVCIQVCPYGCISEK